MLSYFEGVICTEEEFKLSIIVETNGLVSLSKLALKVGDWFF